MASRLKSQRSGIWRRWQAWANRVGLVAKLEMTLTICASLCALATYVALSSDARPDQARIISILLTLDLLLLLPLMVLIGRRILLMLGNLRRGSAGSRLHVRIAILFSAVAAFPPAIMAIASVLFLELGLESWFSDNVRQTVNNSLAVAEAYVNEHEAELKFNLQSMTTEISQSSLWMSPNPLVLQQFVMDEGGKRSLDEVIVFSRPNTTFAIYSRDSLDLGSTARVPRALLASADSGTPVFIKLPGDSKIVGVARVSAIDPIYLYISRRLDPLALEHIAEAEAAVSDYNRLEGRREDLHVRFNAIFILVALLLLLVAMWIGLWFADRLIRPISELAAAADRVRQGDLAARVVGDPGYDEIGVLSRTFNRMTEQLQQQQEALVFTNTELNNRRNFLEALLGDVSAGVIGMDAHGRVNLLNRSAELLLDWNDDGVMGEPLLHILPAFDGLFRTAKQSVEGAAQAHVPIQRGEEERILLARLTMQSHEEAVQGYVLTFDDITDQIADQRAAAWSDVARRIAHEIKNPLTPIQLSAERLKRRYGRLADDQDLVFDQCTDTIIRQVGDLRRMVNEFSAFARMPEPQLAEEDLAELVTQAVFVQEVASPHILVQFNCPDMAVPMVCDGRLLSQALTNLLKNASEAVDARWADSETPDAGRIDVKIEQRGHMTALIVEDNGCGLPKDRSRLVEPYVTTRRRGTGLGLAIVKRITEDHQGELLLQDAESGGARISLILNRDVLSAIHPISSKNTYQDNNKEAIHGA